MDMNLKNYIKIYDVLDKSFCDEVCTYLSVSYDWKQHKFYDAGTKKFQAVSGSKELETHYSDNIDINDVVMKGIWNAFNSYLNDYNFPWFDSWSGFSQVRFNQYKETRQMALHCDHISTLFGESEDGLPRGIPTMTALGSLNNNYSGGELIFFKDTEIKIEQGQVAVFPSNYLYPHKVEPVITGTRYSFVSWAY